MLSGFGNSCWSGRKPNPPSMSYRYLAAAGDRNAEFAEGVAAGVDRLLAVADEVEGIRFVADEAVQQADHTQASAASTVLGCDLTLGGRS